jgi:hypothetical protein
MVGYNTGAVEIPECITMLKEQSVNLSKPIYQCPKTNSLPSPPLQSSPQTTEEWEALPQASKTRIA